MDDTLEAVVCADDRVLVDLFLFAEAKKTPRERIPVPDVSFDLHSMTDGMVLHRFRFKQDDIITIPSFLRFPDMIYTSQRVPISSIEAFCILLARLAYSIRWIDIDE